MRQIEEEYYKVNDAPAASPPKTEVATATAPPIDSLIPPTPFKFGTDPIVQEFMNYISQKKTDEGSSTGFESGSPKDPKNKTTQATTSLSPKSNEDRSGQSLPV